MREGRGRRVLANRAQNVWVSKWWGTLRKALRRPNLPELRCSKRHSDVIVRACNWALKMCTEICVTVKSMLHKFIEAKDMLFCQQKFTYFIFSSIFFRHIFARLLETTWFCCSSVAVSQRSFFLWPCPTSAPWQATTCGILQLRRCRRHFFTLIFRPSGISLPSIGTSALLP